MMVVFPLVSTVFGPAIRQIAAISSTQVQALVVLLITTTSDHKYKNGLVVRLDIPQEYSSTQLNQLFSEIVVTSPTQFTMSFPGPLVFDPFVIPVAPLQAPLTIPIAENVLLLNQAEFNLLPNG